jgi:arylsulfatase A-like enzyme
VACNNPQSKIPTPNVDRLAAQGLRFTDAHSSSGVCVPSRFSLMTGLHALRMKNRGNPEPEYRHYGGNQPTVPLIPEGAQTLASLLADAGYATAMVGKWHLGFQDLLRKPAEPLRGGPVDRGFQRYFGIPSSLDIGPYVLIENDRMVAQPTEQMPAHGTPGWPRDFMGEFWRADRAAPGFRHADVLPAMTARAERDLREFAGAKERPFFLYYAMPAPHSPLMPAEEFRGRTQLGAFSMYGDYVAQMDADIGRLLRVLDETGAAANTLVLVTSDNGPLWYPENVQATGHATAGPWRGMKGDAWEGGHRVPLIARWAGKIPAGATTDALVSLTDLRATVAGLLGLTPAAGDGVDFSPALLGRPWQRPDDHPLVARSSLGATALRSGSWKFIDRLGSGGFSTPQSAKAVGVPSVQLYNLATDPAEQDNLAGREPDKVRLFEQLLPK